MEEGTKDKRFYRRGSDKLKQKLPEILIYVVLTLIAWGIRQEVSKTVLKKQVADLERTGSIRWGQIRGIDKELAQLKNDSESHGDKSDEAIANMKTDLCDLRGDIFRLEGLSMGGATLRVIK